MLKEKRYLLLLVRPPLCDKNMKRVKRDKNMTKYGAIASAHIKFKVKSS